MSKENNTTDSEIIDVKLFLNSINTNFKSFLRLILSIITFYKRKAILFGILLVVGIVGGYFLDNKLNSDKIYKQEIILQPKYEIENFMYGFVDNLQSNLKDPEFLKRIKLGGNLAENIKEVTIEPVIQAVDVLDGLQARYGDEESFYGILKYYNDEKIEEEHYNSFYEHHKLTFYFREKAKDNSKISQIILEYISKNKYYNDLLYLKLKQAKSNLEKNKETLFFLEEYLTKLNKSTAINKEKEMVFYAKESDIATIGSLLERKEELLNTINKQEKTIVLDSELINIVEYNGVIAESKSITNRLLIMFPLLLFGFVSMLFWIKNVFKNVAE